MSHRRQIPPCPGLNRVSSRNYRWIVPHGSTASQRTYCEHCTRKMSIRGTEQREVNACNCDSYRLINKADNGIVNISFWDPTLCSVYETFPINESDTDTYCVKIPSGGRFCIMIQSETKKDQAFRYEVDYINSGDSVSYNLAEESKVFIHESVFIGGSKASNYTYVDSTNPGWELLDGDRVSNYKIVRPGDTMIVKVHFYNLVEHDFMKDCNRNVGTYTLSDNLTVRPESSEIQIQRLYDHAPFMSLPNSDFKLYTKKPLQMKFVFLTDSDQPDSSDTVLHTALTKLLNITNGKLKELNGQLIGLNKQEVSIDQQISRIQESITTVKDVNAKILKYIRTDSSSPQLD